MRRGRLRWKQSGWRGPDEPDHVSRAAQHVRDGMATSGVPLCAIQHWMGRADVRATRVYAHYQPSDAEAETIDAAFISGER